MAENKLYQNLPQTQKEDIVPYQEIPFTTEIWDSLSPQEQKEMEAGYMRLLKLMPSDTCIRNTVSPDHNLTVKEYVFYDTKDIVTGKKFGWKGNSKMWEQILKQYCQEIKCKKKGDKQI